MNESEREALRRLLWAAETVVERLPSTSIIHGGYEHLPTTPCDFCRAVETARSIVNEGGVAPLDGMGG